MRRRQNPDASGLIIGAGIAGLAWWWFHRSSVALPGAPPPPPATPAAAIAANAVAAAAGPPPAVLSTTCTGPVGQQTCTSEQNPAWQAYQLANQPAELAPGQVNPGDVLVSGYDAQGNPVTEWTGPGTLNPQAGEIAGANPGLVQLAQYMGMTPAQTQAWIQTSQAKTGVTPPVLPS